MSAQNIYMSFEIFFIIMCICAMYRGRRLGRELAEHVIATRKAKDE